MRLPDENKVFVDTTAFYALLDPTHEVHAPVVAAWEELLRCGAPLFTTSYVCSELLALVQANLGFDKVQTFLGELRPHVEVLTVDSALHSRTLAGSKRDLGALIPRTSRALMSQFGVTIAFALDGGFVGDRFSRVELGQPVEQPHAPDPPEPSADSETIPRPPRRHGARRSTRASGAGRSVESRPPPPPPRPELICRRAPGAWHWEVLLLAHDECNVAGVRYRGHPLHADGLEYRLSSFAGAVFVDQADGTGTEIALGTVQAPMIFKLADKWSGVGRRMDAISGGHFIVIAPAEWNRKGRPPVAPDATADPAFQAHYFFRDRSPVSEGVGFDECDLATTHAGYSLVGDRLYDDSTEGELFIAKPPELKPGHGVTWARVGEEKDGGWRGKNFLPPERSLADVLDHRQGRFFVRVYDSATNLCDSGEFRYVGSLREILVDGSPHTPEALLPPADEGYSPIKIQLMGQDGAVIRPSLNPNAHHQWAEEEGAIVAEPHPAADEVACTIVTPSGSVSLLIRLPRIWWCLGRDSEASAAWSATTINMTRSEFRAHTDADATVRVSLPRDFATVDVGFNHDLSRSYRSVLTEDAARIANLPLIDFADDSPIDRTWEPVVLYARCGTSRVPLVQIQADAVPEIVSFHANPAFVRPGERTTLRWTTRNADDGSVSIRPEFGNVPRTGSITFTPKRTTRYEISIATSNRETLTQPVLVTVAHRIRKQRSRVVRFMAESPTPQIILFCARPVAVRPGESATLYWTIRNAQPGSVFIRPAIGRVSRTGSIKVTPERTTRYTIAIMTELGALSLPQPRHAVVDVVFPRGKRRLDATVKKGKRRGRRRGKGFSVREICAAGLTKVDARHVCISIDWRRRTVYGFNIETLKGV